MAEKPDAKSIVAQIEASRLQPEIFTIFDLEILHPADAAAHLEKMEIIGAAHEVFGRDGSGGTYHVLSDGRILLIDSEGSAGVVATDFKQFVGIATGLASWRDALRFAGDDKLKDAKTNWEAFVARWDLDGGLDEPWEFPDDSYTLKTPAEARTAIADFFSTPKMPDPFAALYYALHSLNDDVSVEWAGNKYQLFGK